MKIDARIRSEEPDLKEPEPAERFVKTGSIASDVYLDRWTGLATKVYRPGLLVRALYWAAFQAPFPYRANTAALEAARQRRLIAGFLTRAEFGREVVAQVVEIRQRKGKCEFITEFVPGGYPQNRQAANHFLTTVSAIFSEAGLDIWQVWRWNPKALGNVIETPEGEFVIIDLESSLVSPPLPLWHLWTNLRTAQFPSFDDVNFASLRSYIDGRRDSLRSQLGAVDYESLLEATERCHDAMHAWKDSEPRLWGRALRFLLQPFSRSLGLCH